MSKKRWKCAPFFFVDSGAHGLYTEYVIKKHHEDGYLWYKTDDFWEYVDRYASFVKQELKVIDLYANVDVIFNPEMTWKVHRYLEKEHGLRPLPVIHYGSPFSWIRRYARKGYKNIALGGLGQEVTSSAYVRWADHLFERMKAEGFDLSIHGFAMTSLVLMLRYEWHSVDSATWLKLANYGNILVPYRGQGASILHISSSVFLDREGAGDRRPASLFDCHKSRSIRLCRDTIHRYFRIPHGFLRYIDEREIEIGESHIENGKEIIVKRGIINHYLHRAKANALFFLEYVLRNNGPMIFFAGTYNRELLKNDGDFPALERLLHGGGLSWGVLSSFKQTNELQQMTSLLGGAS